MKRYEKVAAALMAAGLALGLALAMRSDGGNLAIAVLWPWALASIALMAAAIAVVNRGWKEEQE